MEQVYGGADYLWGVCHTGNWIRREHRYVWVSGSKRHHHCPVRWVKDGKRTGYAPLHPQDIAGKPPLNLKHAIYPVKSPTLERASLEENKLVKLLDGPPREFRRESIVPLPPAEAPHLEAHTLLQAYMGEKPGALSKGPASGVAITFDHKSQSFMLARQVETDGKIKTVSEPVTGRVGGMQPHGDGVVRGSQSGGAGYSRGGSYGGGSRVDSGGGGSRGYSGGGESHSSGSGGESHGGGGSSSGGGSAPSSGGGGGGASAGGGSHR